jgi:hypothetical protein
VAFLDPYATRTELKAYLRIDAAQDDYDDDLDDVLDSATREINNYCSRQFNRDDVITSTSTQTRVYAVRYPWLAEIDDIHTLADLEIETDTSGDGTYETTWEAADYQLEPLNGIRDGNTGWPYFKIRAIGSKTFPVLGHQASLRVTGHFGWSAVPKDVKQACLMLSAETFKMREAPFGVAGWSEFGAIRVRDIPKVAKLLYPYERSRVKVRG